MEYGFKVVVAPGFADIFHNNSFKNGFLPIVLPEPVVDRLFDLVEANEGYSLAVDLEKKTVTLPDGEVIPFEVEEYRRYRLLNGLDDIGLTLKDAEQIKAFETRRREEAPWLFQE
jgi:3-isopropylmalate/(R)-2-methylmalate dehydratase small subunit